MANVRRGDYVEGGTECLPPTDRDYIYIHTHIHTLLKFPWTNLRMTLVLPHLALPTISSLHVPTGTPLLTAAAWRESKEAEPRESLCKFVWCGGGICV